MKNEYKLNYAIGYIVNWIKHEQNQEVKESLEHLLNKLEE